MSVPDINMLTAAQLRDLLKEADALLKNRLAEELSKIVDDLIAKAGDSGISLTDVVEEIKRRDVSTAGEVTKPKKTKAAIATPWVKGTIYCNQEDNDQSWTGGSPGQKPTWLSALIPKSMPFEEKKKKYAELVKL